MKKVNLIMTLSITVLVIILILISINCVSAVYHNTNLYHSKKLVSAIKEENITAVQEIIEKKPTCVNTYPAIPPRWWLAFMEVRVCYPLNVACDTSNIELIEILIENGADVNCNDGLTPLSITYSSKADNWYEISQILIANGASLDYTTEYSGEDSSVLIDIVQVRPRGALPGYEPESNEEVIEAFNFALENCDHSKVDWMCVLQHSVTNNRIEIVKLLFDQRYCDVNDYSAGKTALMFAAMCSNSEMVQLLLDYGADKRVKDYDGRTAYDIAVEYENTDVIKILEN